MSSNNDDKSSWIRPAQESGSAENADDPLTDAQKQYAVQFLTTEHFTLQTARSATITDSAGRAGLFLSTVSSSVVALAFVGQMSQGGVAFNIFALLLFPTLFFLGLVTFDRVLQSAMEDVMYAQGITRVRHFYVELVPQTKKYFVLSTNDDSINVLGDTTFSKWQWFLTTAGTIMVINSILLGVFAGLLLWAFISPPVLWVVLGGLIVFGVCLAVHYRYQDKRWDEMAKLMPAAFPKDPDKANADTED